MAQPAVSDGDAQEVAIAHKPAPLAEASPAVASAGTNSPAPSHRSSKAGSEGVSATASSAFSEPAPRRLWLVRLPKPLDAPPAQEVSPEAEASRAQLRHLNEVLEAKKLQRDAARKDGREARDALARCRAALQARTDEMAPLRKTLRTAADSDKRLKDTFGDVEARTEAQLDASIAALNAKIEHETIPLAEEKALIAAVAKLSAQRPQVRELEALAATSVGTRQEAAHARAELAQQEGSLKALRAERDAHAATAARIKKREEALNADVEAVLAERRKAKEVLDGCKTQRSHTVDYLASRKYAMLVREALLAGRTSEARGMCQRQMDDTISRLRSEPAFREEYIHLWAQQREATAAGNGHVANGHTPRKEPEQPPAVKAQAAIAAIVQEATAAAAAVPTAAVLSSNGAPAAGGNGGSSQPARPQRASKKQQQATKYVVTPAVEPPDNFELPAVVRLSQFSSGGGAGGAAAAAAKEAERQRNQRAQADAEQRKQRKAQQKAKRGEKKAAVAAGKADTVQQQGGKFAADGAEHVTGAAIDSAHLAGDVAAGEGAAAAVPEQRGKGAAGSAPARGKAAGKHGAPGSKALAPPPSAKRPVNRSLAKQLRGAIKGNEVALAVLATALLLLAVIVLFSSPPPADVRLRA